MFSENFYGKRHRLKNNLIKADCTRTGYRVQTTFLFFLQIKLVALEYRKKNSKQTNKKPLENMPGWVGGIRLCYFVGLHTTTSKLI